MDEGARKQEVSFRDRWVLITIITFLFEILPMNISILYEGEYGAWSWSRLARYLLREISII